MGNRSPLFDQSDCSIHKCRALNIHKSHIETTDMKLYVFFSRPAKFRVEG